MKRAHVIVNGHFVGDFPIHPTRDVRGEDRPASEGDFVRVVVTDDTQRDDSPLISAESTLQRLVPA